MTENESLRKLSKDLREASRTLGADEVRYLVDQYYVLQKARIRAASQIKAMGEAEEPHDVINWLEDNSGVLERNIKTSLKKYAESSRPGRWMMAQFGVGPVIASGMLAHINIDRAKSAGAVWRFAGLDPTVKWGKGKKRPWNARLKAITWKAGESFKIFSGKDECFYGHIYRERKDLEVERNEQFLFKDQAEAILKEKDWSRDTVTRGIYEKGQLPPSHLDRRATRYATKIFLSHVHAVMYEVRHGIKAPRPYMIEHKGHVEMIEIPGWPID